MKKKILVISQYFYPEQFRINDICNTWVDSGYEVTVLTGIPNYPKGAFYDGYGIFKKRRTIFNGVKIIRIPIFPRKNSSLMLALNYISFVISGIIWSYLHKEDYDFVFIYEVSPMTQALPGIKFAKRKHIPTYLYVMDLWPENFEVITGIKNKNILKVLNKMVDYIYDNCQLILTASQSFRKNIVNRGIESDKVLFWPQYAEGFYQPISEHSTLIPDDDTVNLTFTGNIGEAQGLDILVSVAQQIKMENLAVRFNLVGDGRYKKTLIADVKSHGVEQYFNFVAAVPAKDIPKILSSSDATLITMKQNPIFKMTIPAKLQSGLACAKPIIVSADGEVSEIVLESQSGLVSPAGNSIQLFKNIKRFVELSKEERSAMGAAARKYFEDNYQKEKLMNQIDELMTER